MVNTAVLQFAARRQAGERVLVLYFNKSMYQEMVVKLAAESPGTVCSTMDALVLREFLRQAPDLVEPGESSMFHDVSAGGPAYSALALRRALRISEDDHYKGQLAKHTRQAWGRVRSVEVPSRRRRVDDFTTRPNCLRAGPQRFRLFS